MDLQHAPRIFWWSISASIAVVAFGFTFIAWRSSDVSIQVASTTVSLHQAIIDNREIVQQLNEQSKNLEKARTELQKKISALEGKLNKSQISELKDYKYMLDQIRIPTQAISDTTQAQRKLEATFFRDMPSMSQSPPISGK